jgi:glycosyltransferase involved in cell wall biosynthesis
LPFIRLLYRGKIITNIDGLEWKREKWNKVARFILRKSEKAAIKYSDIIIGDNQAVVDYVLQEYKKNIVLIKYGADHVYKEYNKVLFQEYPFCKEKYAITVCRIEPENNIQSILQAFSKQAKIPLVMIGNWKNSDYGLELLNKYSQLAHIHLLDPIYDAEKINFLRSHAFVYIHGHSAGGTNPSVIEAMFLEIPILAFDCTYNRYTTENQCIYWSNPDELYHYIMQIDTLNLHDIGEKMKLVADDKYKWKIIASEYEALFDCSSSMEKRL